MNRHNQLKNPGAVKLCTNCVLPETFPGISFSKEGVCNYCQSFHNRKTNPADLKRRYRDKFLNLLNQLNKPYEPQKHHKPSDRPYDAIMAYSGGKDSSYTIKVLKERFGLRVLAITFNHGFLSPRALKNIQIITKNLGIDHLMVTPNQRVLCHAFTESIGSDVYPIKALERASSICNTCMNLVKYYVLRSAIEMNIPLIAYGWSPGQAPLQSSVLRLNTSMIQQTQKAIVEFLHRIMGDDLSPFMLRERHFRVLEKSVFYNIHPLAFLEYDEKKILGEIKELGWKFPDDTDPNSTNCLLNSFANQIHQEQFRFHPYASEIAGLVREGYMTREDGLKKLSTPSDPKIIEYVKQKLGLSDQ